jgi:hypothetical protein
MNRHNVTMSEYRGLRWFDVPAVRQVDCFAKKCLTKKEGTHPQSHAKDAKTKKIEKASQWLEEQKEAKRSDR